MRNNIVILSSPRFKEEIYSSLVPKLRKKYLNANIRVFTKMCPIELIANTIDKVILYNKYDYIPLDVYEMMHAIKDYNKSILIKTQFA